MKNIIDCIFIFFTLLMWGSLILSFLSKTFNYSMIKSLKEQNYLIENRRKAIKNLLKKLLK